MLKNVAKNVALFLVLTMAPGGCAVVDTFFLPEPVGSAQELFEAGNDAMLDKNYPASIKHFTKLKENYPFSPYSLEAELALADAYFLDSDWLQAVEAYKEFESMHPRHQAIPYVLFQIGVANLNSYTSIDRPPTQVHEAYSYFNRLRETYPGTEYAELAVVKMQQCRRLMAENEIFIGDLYYKNKRYGAAWLRYKRVVEDYSDIEDLYEYARGKVHGTYILYNQSAAEKDRREREGTWHRFLNWL